MTNEQRAAKKEAMLQATKLSFRLYMVPTHARAELLKPFEDPDFNVVKDTNGISAFSDFFEGERHPAGTLHDYRYAKGIMSKYEADKEFRTMLKYYNWPAYLRGLMFVTLQTFGWPYYWFVILPKRKKK